MLKNVALAVSCFVPAILFAGNPVLLDKGSYKPDLGVVLMNINWGRSWNCGQYENAQLESLTFEKRPLDAGKEESIEIKTPSKLMLGDEFLPYALAVDPGEYFLTAFDVKVAKSRFSVSHLRGSKENLIQDGKPMGGSFFVNAGEIVYVGHFGLDCHEEPFLWRFYIVNRKDFDYYVNKFRERSSFVNEAPVVFRLFSSRMFGKEYSLPAGSNNP